MPVDQSRALHPFKTTHWSLVERAGADSGRAREEALASLLTQYMPALRSHLVVRKRIPPHDADDLLQEFIAWKVLERDLIGQADRAKGRFRSFLLTALDNFVSNRMRDREAKKRAASATVRLGEEHDRSDDASPPVAAFEVEWGRQVLRQAMESMERECQASARPDVWGVFNARTLQPILHHEEPVPYPDLVERFRLASPGKASNLLITANRMFARHLREVIGTYELAGEDVEQEIRALREILSQVPAALE